MRQLREKHPEAQKASLGARLFAPVEEIPDSAYQQINGEIIREAALRTRGSGGPSGVDAVGFKRILASHTCCPSVCVCGCDFNADHAMICQRGGLIIQRHNKIRDLEAELLDMVCHDVAVEPTLQPLTGEALNRGANTASDARLGVHCRGFWERQQAAFFDIRVCHPNAASYRDLTPKQVYKLHEDETKRKYASRVLEVEQGTITPLVFTTQEGRQMNASDITLG